MMMGAQPIARAPIQSASPATTGSQYYYPQPGFPPTSFGNWLGPAAVCVLVLFSVIINN